MIEPKYRIKDKADFERIFKKIAELDNEELNDGFIVEGNHDITYGDIKATCELIGYDFFLLPLFLFGGAIPDELGIEDDGTLRLWFD